MVERRLKVAEPYSNDFGRGIARLDPGAFLDLEVRPGDYIGIEGDNTTVAKVHRSDRQDWNTDTIRIDRITQQNADVEADGYATVQKIGVRAADRVELAPSGGNAERFDSERSLSLKRQLLRRSVVEGDAVTVVNDTYHPFVRSPDRSVRLITLATEPEGAVVVTQDTEIDMRVGPAKRTARANE